MASSTQPYGRILDYEQYIDHQLGRTRARIKMTDLLTESLLLVAALVAVLFVEVVLDHVVGLPTWVRRVVLLACAAGGGTFAVLGIMYPLVRRVNGIYAARTIEEADPSFKNSLINYLDLKSRRGEVSSAALAAIEARAVSDLIQVEIDSVVNQRRLMQAAYAFSAVVVVFCLYAALTPKSILDSTRRALLADVVRPANTRLLNIKPGDDPRLSRVVAGTHVPFTVEVQGVRLGRVLLHVSTDGGKFFTARELTPGTSRYDPWQTTIRDVQQSMDYYLTGGDAESPRYHLEVTTAPMVTGVSLDYDFPRYLDLPRRTRIDGGSVEAIEGTIVTVHAQTNEPARSASLSFTRTEPVAMEVSSGDLRELTGQFKVERSGRYTIKFRTTGGQLNPDPVVYDITALPDNPPTASFERPEAAEIELPSNVQVALVMKAGDDHGVKEVTLHVHQKGETLLSRNLLEQQPPTRQFRGTEVLDLAAWKLKPGQDLEYWMTVRDTREPQSNRCETPRRKIRIAAALPPAAKKSADQKARWETQQAEKPREALEPADPAEPRPRSEPREPKAARNPHEDRAGSERRTHEDHGESDPTDEADSEGRDEPGMTAEEMRQLRELQRKLGLDAPPAKDGSNHGAAGANRPATTPPNGNPQPNPATGPDAPSEATSQGPTPPQQPPHGHAPRAGHSATNARQQPGGKAPPDVARGAAGNASQPSTPNPVPDGNPPQDGRSQATSSPSTTSTPGQPQPLRADGAQKPSGSASPPGRAPAPDSSASSTPTASTRQIEAIPPSQSSPGSNGDRNGTQDSQGGPQPRDGDAPGTQAPPDAQQALQNSSSQPPGPTRPGGARNPQNGGASQQDQAAGTAGRLGKSSQAGSRNDHSGTKAPVSNERERPGTERSQADNEKTARSAPEGPADAPRTDQDRPGSEPESTAGPPPPGASSQPRKGSGAAGDRAENSDTPTSAPSGQPQANPSAGGRTDEARPDNGNSNPTSPQSGDGRQSATEGPKNGPGHSARSDSVQKPQGTKPNPRNEPSGQPSPGGNLSPQEGGNNSQRGNPRQPSSTNPPGASPQPPKAPGIPGPQNARQATPPGQPNARSQTPADEKSPATSQLEPTKPATPSSRQAGEQAREANGQGEQPSSSGKQAGPPGAKKDATNGLAKAANAESRAKGAQDQPSRKPSAEKPRSRPRMEPGKTAPEKKKAGSMDEKENKAEDKKGPKYFIPEKEKKKPQPRPRKPEEPPPPPPQPETRSPSQPSRPQGNPTSQGSEPPRPPAGELGVPQSSPTSMGGAPPDPNVQQKLPHPPGSNGSTQAGKRPQPQAARKPSGSPGQPPATGPRERRNTAGRPSSGQPGPGARGGPGQSTASGSSTQGSGGAAGPSPGQEQHGQDPGPAGTQAAQDGSRAPAGTPDSRQGQLSEPTPHSGERAGGPEGPESSRQGEGEGQSQSGARKVGRPAQGRPDQEASSQGGGAAGPQDTPGATPSQSGGRGSSQERGGSGNPRGGGSQEPGDPGQPITPSADDRTRKPPASRSGPPPWNSGETVAPNVPRTELVLRRLEELLKNDEVTPQFEKNAGMTREQLEQFVTRLKQLPRAASGKGREIQVTPGKEPALDPNRAIPDPNTGSVSARSIHRRESVVQDQLRDNVEGARFEVPSELRSGFEAYKSSLSHSRPSRASEPGSGGP